MKTIRNTTTGPLRVPLPRGKVLHLGPRKTGEIATAAADHPPLKKLVEEGKIEILGEGEHHHQGQAQGPSGQISSHGHAGGVTTHHRGER
jgi:hypothetical protein